MTQIVPACVVADLEDDLRLAPGTSVFLESVPTNAGWIVSVVAVRGEIQARAQFDRALPLHSPLPAPNTPLTLCSGIDNIAAFIVIGSIQLEALFTPEAMADLITLEFEEPDTRFDDSEPDFRLEDPTIY